MVYPKTSRFLLPTNPLDRGAFKNPYVGHGGKSELANFRDQTSICLRAMLIFSLVGFKAFRYYFDFLESLVEKDSVTTGICVNKYKHRVRFWKWKPGRRHRLLLLLLAPALQPQRGGSSHGALRRRISDRSIGSIGCFDSGFP